MSHVGFSAAPKVRCTRTRMRAMPLSTPKQNACTDARRCAPTRTPRPMLIHKYRRQNPFLRTTMGNDGVGAANSAAFLARMLQFGDSMFPIGGFSFFFGLGNPIPKRVFDRVEPPPLMPPPPTADAAAGEGEWARDTPYA